MGSTIRVFRELWRGKSLGRTLQNFGLSRFKLSGSTLDVGGGGRKRTPSYRDFLQEDIGHQWMVSDYNAVHAPDFCFDAAGNWPVVEESVDNVLLINCLYIFPDPEAVLKEARRILKPGGRLLLTAPLLFHEAAEPSDYFRFTSQGIRMLIERSGLEVQDVVPYGGRFCSMVDLSAPYLKKLLLFLPVALSAYCLDRVCSARLTFERKHPAPSGYLAMAGKME